MSLKQKLKKLLSQTENPQPDLGCRKEFVTYTKGYVEPLIREYISESIAKMTYPRKVDINLRLDKSWELQSVKTVTTRSSDRNSESHLSYKFGKGAWDVIIDGHLIDYELLVEWDIATGLMALSLTEPKLERLLKGHYVPNVLGEVPHIMPGPKPRKVDDSILDSASKTIEEYKVQYKDYLEIWTIGEEKPMKIPISSEPITEEIEDDVPEGYASHEEYKKKYEALEADMKGGIESLGWKWSQRDKEGMDWCIIDTLECFGGFEMCIKKYLELQGRRTSKNKKEK